MPIPVEPIPDADLIHRQIDFPRMYDGMRQFIETEIWAFPKGEGESVVWQKYAPTREDVHAIGCARETEAKKRRPEMAYAGFRTSEAQNVRAIQSVRGHRFVVVHVPEEGDWHAEVQYSPAEGQFSKSDKLELKTKLAKKWSALTTHNCNQAA